MPKNSVNTHNDTLLRITIHFDIIKPGALARVSAAWSSSTRPSREGGIFWRLPVVLAGKRGTIQLGHCSCSSNRAHCYNHHLDRADLSSGAEDCCLMYFVISWALRWSCNPWNRMKCSAWPIIIHYYIYYLLNRFWLQLQQMMAARKYAMYINLFTLHIQFSSSCMSSWICRMSS